MREKYVKCNMFDIKVLIKSGQVVMRTFRKAKINAPTSRPLVNS